MEARANLLVAVRQSVFSEVQTHNDGMKILGAAGEVDHERGLLRLW